VTDATVLQGDALEVLRGMEAGSVDMVFCDPPYGIDANSGGDLIHRWECAFGGEERQRDARPIMGDSREEFTDKLPLIINELARVLVKGGCCCCCCCGGGGPQPIFAEMTLMMDAAPGMDFKQAVVWDKGGLGMGLHYRRNYEFVLVSQKRGAACKWYDTSHRIANVLRLNKIIPSAEQHPTEKPWQLAAHFIRLHSQPGELVLDCFAGSGSTGEAAIRENRRFLGVEIDPHWREMAERRLNAAQPPLFANAGAGEVSE
jgi:site-specific DNA-methyltransferase (adenine-specific)